MKSCLAAFILVYLTQLTVSNKLYKNFDFSSRSAVEREWNILKLNTGYFNHEKQEYVNSAETMNTANGVLNIRTKKKNNGYVSARLESKETFSCLQFASKKMRVEFVAEVPTKQGAWPALWMNGIESTYGTWPRTGEIDVMEWVWQLRDHIQSSLHWKSAADWGQPNLITSPAAISNKHTYSVDVACNDKTNENYIQFAVDNKSLTQIKSHTWSASFKSNKPSQSKSAPFDNKMVLIINTAVGGDWGGIGVNNYDAFNGNGIVMKVYSVKVYEL